MKNLFALAVSEENAAGHQVVVTADEGTKSRMMRGEESSTEGDEFQVKSVPTPERSMFPSDFPSLVPSDMPSDMPSMVPTVVPTKFPSLGSDYPSIVPTGWGTPKPTIDKDRWATPDARKLSMRISREREQRKMNFIRMH